MSERLLKIEEVAVAIGVSVKTINFWYMFKKENPDNEYAKMLPDYVQLGTRSQRFWYEDSIWKFIEFRKQIPKGRYGIMGGVTHKTNKSTKEKINGKKKSTRSKKRQSKTHTA